MSGLTWKEMVDLHKRITTAVAKSVQERGVSEQEAFRNHMNELRQKNPLVFEAYSQWLQRVATN